MKTSPRMQRTVGEIARVHSLDLATVGSCLRLTLPGCHPLVVEVLGPTLVHVAHIQVNPAVPPGIVLGVLFFTGLGPWIPVEVTVANRGYTEVAWLNLDQSDLTEVAPDAQDSLAVFADGWADSLVAQGWLAADAVLALSDSDRS